MNKKAETEPGPAGRYHHGALREGLLAAAENILEREGIQGLTLRAAAREAGVSHAAPKNHFDDLTGLLSELAARGFNRLSLAMRTRGEAAPSPEARMAAIGRSYIEFATAHPGLFLLMFRGERLDTSRPALREALDAATGILSGVVGARANKGVEAESKTLQQTASVVAAWSLVHGFAMLLLDGRLAHILARLPEGQDVNDLIGAIFESRRAR